MNYLKLDTCDFNNGDGIRVTLWVSGCPIRCEGCHNKHTWDKNQGTVYTQDTENKIILNIKNNFISGLSILGGEPLADYNIDTVLELCKNVKKHTNKTIWLWSGYTLEEILLKQKNIFEYVDYLICGRYIKNLHIQGKYFGSSNQRIYYKGIDITAKLEENTK